MLVFNDQGELDHAKFSDAEAKRFRELVALIEVESALDGDERVTLDPRNAGLLAEYALLDEAGLSHPSPLFFYHTPPPPPVSIK
jgi:hypothetical protein